MATHTVIATYKEYGLAEQVAADLIGAGINQNSVHITSGNGAASTATGNRGREDDDDGFEAGIRLGLQAILISPDFALALCAKAAATAKCVTADPNPNNPVPWNSVTAVKPNRAEAFRAAGMDHRVSDPVALDDVAEAFLTSSTRDVQPISSIDGRSLARCGGRHTTAAADAFAALQAQTLDP